MNSVRLVLMAMTLIALGMVAWAQNSLAALDRALVQLIEDGSALQHALAQKAQAGVTQSDLQALSTQLAVFETKVEKVVSDARLGVEAAEQPEYGKLLEDSLKLSQVAVGLAEGVERLAASTESDSSDQYQNTFETMIRAMLRLSDDIGVMADRILFTEEQIGIMADRIGEMADRILETQRIQNENIARVHETANRLIDRLALDRTVLTEPQMASSTPEGMEQQDMQAQMQQSREVMLEQREAQQQMQAIRMQQQSVQEQMQILRGF